MKKIFAIVASIAFLLVAGAVDFSKGLPIGNEARLRNSLATNSTGISLVVSHDEDEFGPDVWINPPSIQFIEGLSFPHLEKLIRETIISEANKALTSPYYRSNSVVSVFFGVGYVPVRDEFGFTYTFFGYGSGESLIRDGKVNLERVYEIPIQFQRDVAFESASRVVASASLRVKDLSGNEVFFKDTSFDPTEEEIYVRSGTLYLFDRWLVGGYKLQLTVRFSDGSTAVYDENGDLPQPKLKIELVNGNPLVSVVGTDNELQLQSAPNLNGPWTNWPVPISSVRPAAVPAGKNMFFRIAP